MAASSRHRGICMRKAARSARLAKMSWRHRLAAAAQHQRISCSGGSAASALVGGHRHHRRRSSAAAHRRRIVARIKMSLGVGARRVLVTNKYFGVALANNVA